MKQFREQKENKLETYRLTALTASQSTPWSKNFHLRLVSPNFKGGAKQAPLLAASPSPGIWPIAFSTFSCESPETTKTVLLGSAHNAVNASET